MSKRERDFWLVWAVILTAWVVLFNWGPDMTQQAVEQAVNRNVLVETENSAGSGVILQTGLVLTASHLIETRSEIKVDGKVATIVIVDPINDLMILEVETAEYEPVALGRELRLLEPVISVGNPLQVDNVVNMGRVVKLRFEENFFLTDTLAIPGFSGGGVYNMQGELVGIAIAMISTNRSSAMLLCTPITPILKYGGKDELPKM